MNLLILTKAQHTIVLCIFQKQLIESGLKLFLMFGKTKGLISILPIHSIFMPIFCDPKMKLRLFFYLHQQYHTILYYPKSNSFRVKYRAEYFNRPSIHRVALFPITFLFLPSTKAIGWRETFYTSLTEYKHSMFDTIFERAEKIRRQISFKSNRNSETSISSVLHEGRFCLENGRNNETGVWVCGVAL